MRTVGWGARGGAGWDGGVVLWAMWLGLMCTGTKPASRLGWVGLLCTEALLPAAFVGEPAHEVFKLDPVLRGPLGFGQARGAPKRYEFELFADAAWVLGFHVIAVRG